MKEMGRLPTCSHVGFSSVDTGLARGAWAVDAVEAVLCLGGLMLGSGFTDGDDGSVGQSMDRRCRPFRRSDGHETLCLQQRLMEFTDGSLFCDLKGSTWLRRQTFERKP